MIEFAQAIPFSFAALFPVINPVGSAVIFLSVTAGIPSADLYLLARKIAVNTFFLLLTVLITGTWILRFFGISIPVVQIGGGLVLAYIGWTLLNQPTDADTRDPAAVKSGANINDMAFFPLTLPITAGPGCIAVAITLGAHAIQNNDFVSAGTMLFGMAIGVLLSAMTVFFCYRYADRLTKMLGPAGTRVTVRLAAFVNLCIGIEIIWRGVHALIG